MGAKLKELYKKVEEVGSIKAKMRLALLTGITSAKAEEEADSPELIAKFENALKEIEKEFK
jgi:hypothetical protein